MKHEGRWSRRLATSGMGGSCRETRGSGARLLRGGLRTDGIRSQGRVPFLLRFFFVRLPRATASEGPSTATELLGASRLNAAAAQCSRDRLRKTRLMG